MYNLILHRRCDVVEHLYSLIGILDFADLIYEDEYRHFLGVAVIRGDLLVADVVDDILESRRAEMRRVFAVKPGVLIVTKQAQHQSCHCVLLAICAPRAVLVERRHHCHDVANGLFRRRRLYHLFDDVVQAPGRAGLERNVVAEQHKRRRLPLPGDADDGGKGELLLLGAADAIPQRHHGRRNVVGKRTAIAHESLTDERIVT